ncbi:related to HXT5 - Hexose transporter with moderate affinity for glucose [Melanopsichium pennsylvanicum]|uniref:Related to HXT5 - Hexose transporter with moderate affinity for glucose n=1 Tax=Melanopsichium pennsylvanicum TaxID=63383 RepID=A0AAJ5C7T2_9BASI|nr:related to HXT5 - Hexose transporter with moderate affinity for glucose [Melanopsichium pennsylvanicum]
MSANEKISPMEEKFDANRLDTVDASSHDSMNYVSKVRDQSTVANPLAGLSKSQLLRDVENFAEEKRLTEDLELLKRGALLAQRPAEYQQIDELKTEEKHAIAHEYAHKWSHPFMLYLTIFSCSIGAATQGWDQTGSNGANLSFPQEFNIPETATKGIAPGAIGYVSQATAEKNQWLVGLVNAAPYIASAVLGCWLSDPLNNLCGRRGCIFITALILIATPIASAFTHNWWELFITRFCLGIGMGIKASTTSVYAAENSPPQIRGALVMGWQLWTAFGIFLGFCANVVVADVGKIAWRLQLGSAFIPALPLAILIYFCPESPRWLMKKNRYPQALRSLKKLRHNHIQAARDLYYIHVQLLEEAKIIRGETYLKRFSELFTIPRVRRATVGASVVMLVFAESGSTSRQALYASLGFGAINFVFAFPALFTIDTFGRRSLLLFTFPQMAWTLLAAGLCFLIPEGPGKARLGLIALFIYLFACFYSVGEGPVPFTYSAEVFPLAQREQGMAWAVATCLFWAAVLSITFPRMLRAMTPTGAFGFYAGLNVISFVLIYFFVPETARYTLEELDAVFSVPHAKFIEHQNTKAVPYWFKTKILRRKNVERPAPLIQLDKNLVGAGGVDAA